MGDYLDFDQDTADCLCSDITSNDYSPSYRYFNLLIIILLLPLVSVFGVFSNVINVFLYCRPQLINSSNTYLCALACSDFFVVVTGVCIFWIDSARSYIPALEYAPYTIVYTLPIGYMAQTCSVYFTVAAAVDCYVKVCWSPLFPDWNSVKRAKHVVFAITVLSVVYNFLRYGQFSLRQCEPENMNVSIVEICPTKLYMQINTVYNVYMYMILMTFLPFLLLSILNGLIVSRVRQAPIAKPEDLDETSDEEGTSPSPEDTITMVMVVVMFLCCNILALVVNVVESFFDPDPLALNFMTDTSNFLVIFNSSVNFIIYLIFCSEFRILFLFYAKRLCVVQIGNQSVASRLSLTNKCHSLKMTPVLVKKNYNTIKVRNSYPNCSGDCSLMTYEKVYSSRGPKIQRVKSFELENGRGELEYCYIVRNQPTHYCTCNDHFAENDCSRYSQGKRDSQYFMDSNSFSFIDSASIIQ